MSTAQDLPEHSFHWNYSEFDDRNFQIGGRTLFFIILIFSIILTVAIIFLLTRWLCRCRNILPISDSHAPPHAPPQPKGLDPADVSKIPITLYRSGADDGAAGEEEEEGECAICLGVFVDGEKVKVLPECRHCYHSECVNRWLVAQSSCPLCRTSLRVDSDDSESVIIVTES